MEDLFRHIEYIGNRWGIEYVGVSSDIFPMPEYPFVGNYKDITILKYLYKGLRKHLKEDELDQIFYRNWERVIANAVAL